MEEKLKEKIFKSLSQTIKDSFTINKKCYDETNPEGKPIYRHIKYNVSFKLIIPYDDRSAEIATEEVLDYIKDKRQELIKEYRKELTTTNNE